MIVSWRPGRPVACAEHGRLTDRPLPDADAAVVLLDHLASVHGADVARALEQARARRDQAATLAP